MEARIKKVIIHAAVWLCRIIVGGSFIFSGFAKADDPWGSIFKFEQYLAVWGISEPRSLVLSAVIGLSILEFILGVAILTGMYRRKAPWLVLVMMAFFLPLTGYLALTSPIEDCGCFGDALILSNGATFAKNLLLTALTVVLVIYNRMVTGAFAHALQWIAGVVSGVYVLLISFIGYYIQPLVDYRNFPKGSSLIASEEQEGIKFIYERAGERKAFDSGNLPSEDDGWIFVGREEGEKPRMPLIIEDFDGDNVTEDLISFDGEMLMLVIPEPERADLANTTHVNRIYEVARRNDIGMLAVVGDATPDDISEWKDLSMAEYPIYTAEGTALKSLARGNMSLVYIDGGEIVGKKSLSIISTGDILELENGSLSLRGLVDFDGKGVLSTLTRIYVLILVVLFLLSLPHSFYKMWRRRRNVSEG